MFCPECKAEFAKEILQGTQLTFMAVEKSNPAEKDEELPW